MQVARAGVEVLLRGVSAPNAVGRTGAWQPYGAYFAVGASGAFTSM